MADRVVKCRGLGLKFHTDEVFDHGGGARIPQINPDRVPPNKGGKIPAVRVGRQGGPETRHRRRADSQGARRSLAAAYRAAPVRNRQRVLVGETRQYRDSRKTLALRIEVDTAPDGTTVRSAAGMFHDRSLRIQVPGRTAYMIEARASRRSSRHHITAFPRIARDPAVISVAGTSQIRVPSMGRPRRRSARRRDQLSDQQIIRRSPLIAT